MTNKNLQKLETISFRGERNLWLDFVHAIKKNREKNTWGVLESFIKDYIKNLGDGS
jgi:hypothetical protein